MYLLVVLGLSWVLLSAVSLLLVALGWSEGVISGVVLGAPAPRGVPTW